jgi:hypothetical protein
MAGMAMAGNLAVVLDRLSLRRRLGLRKMKNATFAVFLHPDFSASSNENANEPKTL